MHLTKMQGLGNDYLYMYGEPENPEKISIALSDRHFGIGSDGLILISPSNMADFKMRIFNADGSEARMCGNGIRCVGKYVFDKGYTDKKHLTIETLSGIRTLDLITSYNNVTGAAVDMGKAAVSEPISINVDDETVTLTPVNVGNPHAVMLVDDADTAQVEELGRKIENADAFPGGVNVEFIQVIDSKTIRMRVWERGSGITMACGTGACASVAAAVSLGLCARNEFISVRLDGGDLNIKVSDNSEVTMIGPAQTVCECEVEL